MHSLPAPCPCLNPLPGISVPYLCFHFLFPLPTLRSYGSHYDNENQMELKIQCLNPTSHMPRAH